MSTFSSSSSSSNNQFRRFRLGAALFAWSYSFDRESPKIDFQSFGVEIGISLSGTRVFESRSRGHECFGPSRLSLFNVDEPYSVKYQPSFDGSLGREVGFLVRADYVEALIGTTEHGITFARRNEALTDPNMIELGVAIAGMIDRDDDLPSRAGQVESEVRSFIHRYADFVRIDPLERARLDLIRHFSKPLYMRHFAAIAGVHEETFARKFAARYGVTPARYRMLVRLKEAAMLVATRPDLSIRDVAKAAGFEDPAYFHRAFAAAYRTTPVSFGRGFSDRPKPLSDRPSSGIAA